MGWGFNEQGPTIGDQVRPVCAFKDEPGHECLGMIEWHHVIKQQRLRNHFKYGAYWNPEVGHWRPRLRTDTDGYLKTLGFDRLILLDDIIGDERNRMWLCSEAAHEPVTNARIHVVVPEPVWQFADEYGLRGMLENDLARQR